MSCGGNGSVSNSDDAEVPVDATDASNATSATDAADTTDTGPSNTLRDTGVDVAHDASADSMSKIDSGIVGDSGHDAGIDVVDASHDDVINVVDASHDAGIDSPTVMPTCSDGIKNGSETGVDCGGPTCSPCSTGANCLAQTDCAVGGCDYTGHCIASKSCVLHHGGDSCGSAEDTNLGPGVTANVAVPGEESCCVSIPIPGTNYTVDKYLITAGRIRAFVNAFNGDLRSFTETIPATNNNWNHNWNAYIPSTLLEVDEQLGPYPAPLTPDPYNPDNELMDNIDGLPFGLGLGQWRDGCTMGSPGKPDGARTWWSNRKMGADQATVAYPQDFLDDKEINCIDSYFLTAFCIWDGGHLATLDELAAAWGPGQFPWSAVAPNVSIDLNCSRNDSYGNCLSSDFQNPQGVDSNGFDMRSYVVHEFGGINFEFINPYTYNYDPYNLFADLTYHIAAPGRFPLGQGPAGHMDLVGESYPATQIVAGLEPSNVDAIVNVDHVGTTAGTGSFEIHPIEPGNGNEQKDPLFRPAWWAYYAMGGRCAR